MAEKDVVALEYLEDNAHFADIINTCYFHGAQVVKPSDIKERDRTEKISKKHARTKNPTVLQRDIMREVDIQMKATIIAVENQSEVHYAMPLRVMALDALNYYRQWKEISKEYQEMRKKKTLEKTKEKGNQSGDAMGKDIAEENNTEDVEDLIKLSNAEFLSGFSKKDRLVPVTTLVLYFGTEEWDGPRCLRDIIDLKEVPQILLDYFADYPIHIIDVRTFQDYELFQTEWRWIFGFLQRDKDKKALRQYVKDNETVFRNLSEDTYDMISQFSRARILKETKEDFVTEGGEVDMCKALDDMWQEALEIGEARGMMRGIISMCQELGASVEEARKKIMKECALTEEKAKECILEYWK